jgi:gliding motility-associated-like protein
MKKIVAALTVISSLLMTYGQSNNWSHKLKDEKGFTENKGQFSIRKHTEASKVAFAYDGGAQNYNFTKEGVIFELSDKQFRSRTEEEKSIRKDKKQKGFESLSSWQSFQQKDQKGRFEEKRDVVSATWLGSNPDARIIPMNQHSFYHSYSFYNDKHILINENNIKTYKKLKYVDMYPNIDIVYEFHEEIGIKYSIIVKPGGNVNDVKLKYSNTTFVGADGKIHVKTQFGDIIDHTPVTFYDGTNQIISSSYSLVGQEIHFNLGSYDATKTVVIDPWTQTPSFATNWDCVWECEKDAAGNVYIIGGVMPLQLLKYNAAGALQWTYNTPYDSTMWLGTFATDDAGNSFVSNGSTAMIQRISTAGALVWNNNSPGGLFTSTEFWSISFNCDQTKLVIGGTGGFIPPVPYIYEMNMANGNVLSSLQVTGSPGGLFDPREVRSITACGNGKYYYLTHDSLGYIHSNLSSCGTLGATNTKFGNGFLLGYKCENYRYNNTGIMALKSYDDFIFVHRGNQLQKRNFFTGAVIATANIPAGSYVTTTVPLIGTSSAVGNSGIDIDNCGNIYIGSTNAVVKYDQNLNQLATYPTAFNVYDVHVSTSGDIIVCGSTGTSSSNSRTGSIQSFAATACAPITTTCCDASVCQVGPYCQTDPAITLTPITTTGGTWSASCGACINATTGSFNPATAGLGTHTITYTLTCGSEQIQIVVNNCASLTACVETNGNYTVSGGTGPYTWSQWLPGSTVTVTNAATCTACGGTWNSLFGQCLNGFIPVTSCTTPAGYAALATGTTVTPTTNFPIQVEDSQGNILTINSAGQLVPCGANPCATFTTSVSAQTNVNCFGQSTGSATVSASGGTAPYTYTWTPGNLSGASQSNLAAGTYTIAILDAASCPGSMTVTITQPTAALSATTSSTNSTCGSSNGTATVIPTGGTGPYTFLWSPSGGTGATASNLAGGPYSVLVTDALVCTTTQNVTVNTTGGPTVSISTQNNVNCFGLSTGSATVSASGGTVPYTYTWMPGSLTGATQNNLAATSYTVTALDAGGCTGTVTVIITQPTSALTATTSSIPATCGATDGGAGVLPTGGTGPYTYQWSPGGTTNQAISNVAAGAYSVQVSDALGCQITQNVTVSSTGGPTLTSSNIVGTTCSNTSNGSATVNAIGGTAPLTYSWLPTGGTNSSATGLAGGSYTVNVTDAAGCLSSINVVIPSPTAINIVETVTNTNCGASTGSIVLALSGGTGAYSYTWTPALGTTNSLSNLASGAYTVNVIDANGCSATENYTVGVTGGLTLTVNPLSQIILAGESVQITASGATTYTWTPTTGLSCTNCSNPIASPTVTTTYTVTGTDASGCIGTANVTIVVEQLCGEIFIPTIFSPNDDGLNDFECVMGGCVNTMVFAIYNRWGEKVFESNTIENCWDGTYKGKKVNTGVYVYKLNAVLNDGTEIEKAGNINVVR